MVIAQQSRISLRIFGHIHKSGTSNNLNLSWDFIDYMLYGHHVSMVRLPILLVVS